MAVPLSNIAARTTQFCTENDQLLAADNSVFKASTTKPFGDSLPMAASQSGSASNGKKLPPIISMGNTTIVEIRLAAFLFENSICSAANHANKPAPAMDENNNDGRR